MNATDLRMKIENKLLSLADEQLDMTRGDIQGRASVVAMQVIADVAQFIINTDYDLEDLL